MSRVCPFNRFSAVNVSVDFARGLSMVAASVFVFVLALASTESAMAAIALPKNLSLADREEALKIVGFGTSAKVLSDPYPLGGYLGIEAGISIETLPTDDLGRLGDRLTSPQQDVSFPKFTIGKGLYNDVDAFLQFTPYNRQDELSQFGGLIRWGFRQATFLPLSASLVLHYNSGNIGNLLTTKSYGADLMGGVNVNNVALFGGFGILEAEGTFVGGATGITDTGRIEQVEVGGWHTVVGAQVRFSNLFLAVQLDRYTVPVFSGKLGMRF